jgi:hypothetical protein
MCSRLSPFFVPNVKQIFFKNSEQKRNFCHHLRLSPSREKGKMFFSVLQLQKKKVFMIPLKETQHWVQDEESLFS